MNNVVRNKIGSCYYNVIVVVYANKYVAVVAGATKTAFLAVKHMFSVFTRVQYTNITLMPLRDKFKVEGEQLLPTFTMCF